MWKITIIIVNGKRNIEKTVIERERYWLVKEIGYFTEWNEIKKKHTNKTN